MDKNEPSLFPVLRYDNAPATIDWLQRAFGFDNVFSYEGSDETVLFCQMYLNGSPLGTGTTRPGLKHAIAVYVSDPDSHYERARASGIEITNELADTDFGARLYGARDPGGHLWSFGTHRPEQQTECHLYPSRGYTDAAAAIELLQRAFGFQQLARYDNEDGSIAHAELKLGSGVVMLGTRRDDPSNPWANVGAGIYAYVPDVDKHYQRARSAGAEIVRELNDTDYGAREYSVRDLEGNLWSFGTYLPGSDPS